MLITEIFTARVMRRLTLSNFSLWQRGLQEYFLYFTLVFTLAARGDIIGMIAVWLLFVGCNSLGTFLQFDFECGKR